MFLHNQQNKKGLLMASPGLTDEEKNDVILLNYILRY